MSFKKIKKKQGKLSLTQGIELKAIRVMRQRLGSLSHSNVLYICPLVIQVSLMEANNLIFEERPECVIVCKREME